MIAAYQPLTIEEDVDFELRISWIDANGNIVPISTDSSLDVVFAIALRGQEASPIVYRQKSTHPDDFATPGSGLLVINIDKDVIDATAWNRAYYSVKVYYLSNWIRLLEGPCVRSTEVALVS